MSAVYAPCKQNIIDVSNVLREFLLRRSSKTIPVEIAILARIEMASYGIQPYIIPDDYVRVAQIVSLNRMDAAHFVSHLGNTQID